MNLGAIKTALRRYAGVDTTDPLVDWINAAMHEFEEAYDWPFMEGVANQPTVASNTQLTLPADFFKLAKAKVVVDRASASVARAALTYVPRIRFEDESTYDPFTTGEPSHYTLIGMDQMFLWPIPDGVYTVRVFYEKGLADLASDSDIPGLPTRYHYTIVEGAAVRALQAESEEDRANTARGIFEDSIDRHITKLGGSRQSGDFQQTRDVMGYGS
jgi:hypothetical protein